MKDTQTVGDVLLQAAAELDEHGWCIDELQDYAGHMCALGALHTVLWGNAHQWSGSSRQMKMYRACQEALMTVVDDCGYGVAGYNNRQLKNKQDALDWFNKAALNEGITDV